MIRYQALITAGYPDGNDCDVLKSASGFEMPVSRGRDQRRFVLSTHDQSAGDFTWRDCAQMHDGCMVDLFCDSFDAMPWRIPLDINDTEDEAQGRQQLAPFNARYDSLQLPANPNLRGKDRQACRTPDEDEVTLVLH